MKCSVRDQKRLLEMSRLHNDIEVLEAQAVNLPEKHRLDEVLRREALMRSRTVTASLTLAEMDAELFKLNSDIAKLRRREADDRQRLTVTSDRERRRDLNHDINAAQRIRARLESQRDDIEAQRDQHLKRPNGPDQPPETIDSGDSVAAARRALDDSIMAVRRRIDEKHRKVQVIKNELPDEIVEAYDIQREDHGVGAAQLIDRVCQGCHMSLDNATLTAFRKAPVDELLQCPECNTYLIRYNPELEGAS